MKDLVLYAFDSCPYCLRVRAVLALKGIAHRIEWVGAGDWQQPFIQAIGRFQVPVLSYRPVLEQEDSERLYLADSSEIIVLLDQYYPSPQITLPAGIHDDWLLLWLAEQSPALNALTYARMLQASLPELASVDARQYFSKSRASFLPEDSHLCSERTAHFCQQIQLALMALQPRLQLQALLSGERLVDWQDIYAFAALRNLALVAEFDWPQPWRSWLAYLSRAFAIDLLPAISCQQLFCAEPGADPINQRSPL